MKFYVSFRFAIRFILTSTAILTILLLINDKHKHITNKLGLFKDESYQVDLKKLQSPCTSQSQRRVRHEMYDICACPRAKRPLLVRLRDGEELVQSACDVQATARGFNQTVVSYTFYGAVSGEYFQGIDRNVKWVAQMYPGYVMRLYHDLDADGDNVTSKALCDLWCANEHLDLCHVEHIPYDVCDQHLINARMWRFLVLGDQLVDRFLIRDIDSDIMPREVAAVQEWISEGKNWHIMRDHPYHWHPILAGMWGGTNRNLTMTTTLRKLFFSLDTNSKVHNLDQALLKTILWPIIQNDMVAHDSYTCQSFFGSRPWPTRREKKDFVGNKFPWHKSPPYSLDSKCPVQCRPKEHQDWDYC